MTTAHIILLYGALRYLLVWVLSVLYLSVYALVQYKEIFDQSCKSAYTYEGPFNSRGLILFKASGKCSGFTVLVVDKKSFKQHLFQINYSRDRSKEKFCDHFGVDSLHNVHSF